MSYTPVATNVTEPADTGVLASTAAAEFRAIKAYMASTLLAGDNVAALSATKLKTARTINGTSFDGTANVTVTAAGSTLTGTSLAAAIVSSSLTSVGTLTSLTVSGTAALAATTHSGAATFSALATHSVGLTAGNAAQAGATVLDWYQEGTWTPGITFSGAAVGVTYATQTARWTRIGDTVFFRVQVVLTSKGSSTGGINITGFPFPAGTFCHALCSPNNGISGATGVMIASSVGVGGNLSLSKYDMPTNTNSMSDANIDNTFDVTITGFYFV